MEYKLKFNDINEIRQLKEDFNIKNLLDELKLSSQNIISKKNGELTIEDSVIKMVMKFN